MNDEECVSGVVNVVVQVILEKVAPVSEEFMNTSYLKAIPDGL